MNKQFIPTAYQAAIMAHMNMVLTGKDGNPVYLKNASYQVIYVRQKLEEREAETMTNNQMAALELIRAAEINLQNLEQTKNPVFIEIVKDQIASAIENLEKDE